MNEWPSEIRRAIIHGAMLSAGGCFVEEVNRKGADRLRQDSDAGPGCGDGQRAFRGDDLLRGGIGHGVEELTAFLKKEIIK